MHIKDNTTFTLAHNANLEVEKLIATNATLNLGSNQVWIDSKDGENVKSTLYGGNMSYAGYRGSSYGDGKAYGVGEDMEFNQILHRDIAIR